MRRKKMTLRFDLDRPEDRGAWEYLQNQNGVSMNRAVLNIINQAEQVNCVQEMIRNTIREELSAALKEISFQPEPMVPVDKDGMDDTIMVFLENFA